MIKILIKYKLLFLSLVILLTVLACLKIPSVEINTDFSQFLPDNDPEYELYKALKSEIKDDREMKSYLKILTLLLLSIAANLNAQPSASFYFTTAFPINDYRLFDDEVGYGGNLEFLFITPSKAKPMGMGISFSYFTQGLFFATDSYTGETILSSNKANNFSNLHLIFQLAPTGGTVRPYIETFFGGSYIFSYSQIFTLDYVPVSLYVDDWAWSYGVGGGFKFLIGGDEDNGSFYLDLKGRYMMSSDVSVLDRNSIRYANNSFYYDVNETQINFVAVQLGLVFYFR